MPYPEGIVQLDDRQIVFNRESFYIAKFRPDPLYIYDHKKVLSLLPELTLFHLPTPSRIAPGEQGYVESRESCPPSLS